MAILQNQYKYYSLKNLPNINDEIEKSYFNITKEIKQESDYISPLSFKENLLDKTSKLFKKTDELLAYSKKKFQTPQIALIITNLGLNRKSTELALQLPQKCALGFLPYTKTLKPLFNEAKDAGHEVFLYLPLQSRDSFDDLGKYAMNTDLPPEEIARRLHVILSSQINYDGVYSSYREIFTDNIETSNNIFDQIANQDLVFVMGKGKNDKTEKLLQIYNNLIHANIILDEEVDRKAIETKLEELIFLAKKNGFALGYSQGFVLSIEMIRNWLPSLKERGISLVPISSIIVE